jgi:nucleoside-diphosphate-sugar epimerase
MKVFITGACGRLGQAVCALAQDRGIELVGIDVQGWPAGLQKPSCLELHEGAMDDGALIDRLLPGCDAIINAAGLHGGDLERATLEDFIGANVGAVARLLERAVKHGVKGVALSSTMEVLIGRSGEEGGMTVLNEESPVRCDSAYSTSKHLMEELGHGFAREHLLSIASLRYMAFGYKSEAAGGVRLLSRLLPARDAASAALLAATTPGLKGEVLNIGPETPIRIQDVPEILADPAGVVERYFPGATGLLEARGIKVKATDLLPVTSTQRAREILGWRASWTFAHWLERCRQEQVQAVQRSQP